MLIAVTGAAYSGNYRLTLEFNDGTHATVDLRDKIFADQRKIVQELRDEAAFRKFRVDLNTVVWDNGFDLAPEFLHRQAQRGAGGTPHPEPEDPRNTSA